MAEAAGVRSAAGKAQPNDVEGKTLILEFTRLASEPDLRDRVVFLEDYDISSAQRMVGGVDVWINTPRRTWEACGTSGMKVLVNGGLNLSTLDGWWVEAYRSDLGWVLGDHRFDDHDDAAEEAAQFYEILERDLIPQFYERDLDGLPRAWIARVRASMATLTAQFCANRMAREYLERLYLGAADSFARRSADNARIACELNSWREQIRVGWPHLRFGTLHIDEIPEQNAFAVEVYMGEMKPDLVRVELYADPSGKHSVERVAMRRGRPIEGTINAYFFRWRGCSGRRYCPCVRFGHIWLGQCTLGRKYPSQRQGICRGQSRVACTGRELYAAPQSPVLTAEESAASSPATTRSIRQVPTARAPRSPNSPSSLSFDMPLNYLQIGLRLSARDFRFEKGLTLSTNARRFANPPGCCVMPKRAIFLRS